MASVPRAHVTQKFRPFKRQSSCKQGAPFFTISQKHTQSLRFFFLSPPSASGFVCFFARARVRARPRTGNQLPACWIS